MSYKVNHYTPQPCSSDLNRCLKRRRGTHFGDLTVRGGGGGGVVLARKQVTYKLSDTKSGISGPKRVTRPLFKWAFTHSNRQHHSCCLHIQGSRHDIVPTVCPTVANPDLVFQESGQLNVVADKLSRLGQIVQTKWSLLPEIFQLI